MLLARGAAVDAADDFNRTPLFWSSLYQHQDVVATLISHGMWICSVIFRILSFMQVIYLFWNIVWQFFLLSKSRNYAGLMVIHSFSSPGAYVNMLSRDYGTVLDAAERGGDPEVIQMLKTAGRLSSLLQDTKDLQLFPSSTDFDEYTAILWSIIRIKTFLALLQTSSFSILVIFFSWIHWHCAHIHQGGRN